MKKEWKKPELEVLCINVTIISGWIADAVQPDIPDAHSHDVINCRFKYYCNF